MWILRHKSYNEQFLFYITDDAELWNQSLNIENIEPTEQPQQQPQQQQQSKPVNKSRTYKTVNGQGRDNTINNHYPVIKSGQQLQQQRKVASINGHGKGYRSNYSV